MTSYLSIALSKTLPHSKAIKNAKKLSVFDKNDSRCLSNFLQRHIFWNFDYISRTYNQVNYRDIWFAKVINNSYHNGTSAFLVFFSETDLHLNAVEIVNNVIDSIHFLSMTKNQVTNLLKSANLLTKGTIL